MVPTSTGQGRGTHCLVWSGVGGLHTLKMRRVCNAGTGCRVGGTQQQVAAHTWMRMVTVVPEGCPMQAKVTCTSSSAHTSACCSCSRHSLYASASLSGGGVPAGSRGHSACSRTHAGFLGMCWTSHTSGFCGVRLQDITGRWASKLSGAGD